MRRDRAANSIAPFLLKKDAENFASKSGGKVLSFDEALKVARQWRLRRETRRTDAVSASVRAGTRREPIRAASSERPVAAPHAGTVPAPRGFCPANAQTWLALHRAEIRSYVIGAISLGAVSSSRWHLLTTYRVSFHVRFGNVPTPAQVFRSFARATHDGTLLHHVVLSCRRIAIGFVHRHC